MSERWGKQHDRDEPRPVEGEILSPETPNPIFFQPSPFKSAELSKLHVAPGSTLATIVADATRHLPLAVQPHVEVLLGEHVIPREKWALIKAKASTVITIRVRPGGKGGKNILRAVLMIAAVVALTYLTAGTGTGFLAGALSTGSAALNAGIVALGTLVVTLALNALIPPPGLAGADGNPRYTISNLSNQLTPYAPIPRIFGRVRVYPNVVGHPYSEVVGKKQYLRVLLMAGYGPLHLDQLKIGNTPFENFEGSSYEINEGGPDGWGGNATLDLYSRAIKELPLNINMDEPGYSIIQTTEFNTQEISIDITMPNGLTYFKPKGGNDTTQIDFYVKYRPVGTSDWLEPDWLDNPEGWNHDGGHFRPQDNTQTAIIGSARWKVPTGQYEVQIRRDTPDAHNAPGNGTTVNYASWTVLRSVTTDQPVVQPGVALIALRLKATGSLNGVPDTFNCVATSYLPVTTDGTTWNYQLTRSPAWAWCDILRRRGPDVMLPDKRIDIQAVQAWDAACSANGADGTPMFYFDGVISGGSMSNAMTEIASIGRAKNTNRNGKFSVVMDTIQPVPVQHITPRNSWNFTGSKVFIDQPHAIRVQFLNELKDYAQDELVVYNDGYDKTTATRYEVLDLTSGTTRIAQAHREGRYHMAVAKLRPESFSVTMDIESLRCTMGDKVLLNHDVILVGSSYGRVVQAIGDGSGNVTSVIVDNGCPMEVGKTYSLRCRHQDGSSSIAPINTVQGEQTVLTYTTPIPTASAPLEGDLFMMGETGRETFPCIVTKITRGEDLSATLMLAPYNEAIFNSDTTPIPPYDSLITLPLPPAQVTPLPPTLTARSDNTATVMGTDGTIYNRIIVDITPPASGGTIISNWEVQYQAINASVWQPAGSTGLFGADTTSVNIDGVFVGDEFNIRGRSLSSSGLASDWVVISGHTVIGKTSAPDFPTGAYVTPIYGGNVVRWTNPDNPDLRYVIVSAAATNDSSQAAVLATTRSGVFAHDNIGAGVHRYYWLQAANTTGVLSELIFAGDGVTLSLGAADPDVATIQQQVDQLMAGNSGDTVPPGVPTGLTSDGGVIQADGTIDLTFSWDANTEADLDYYTLLVTLNGGGAVPYVAASNKYTFHGLQPNTSFSAQVQAVDKSANRSGYSGVYSSITTRDTTPPGTPGAISVNPELNGVLLTVACPPDADLAFIRFHASGTNDYSTSVGIGIVNGSPGRTVNKLVAQASGVTVYYWATAVDTSGNESAPSSVAVGTTYSVSNADMTPGLIIPKASISSLSDSGIEGQISSLNGQVVKYTSGAWHYALTDAGNLTGQITNTQIGPNSIDTPQLRANAVTTNILAAGAVTTAQLSAGAVTASKVGVLGESLFPDPQVQDRDWWFSNPTGHNQGYTNPDSSYGTNNAAGWILTTDFGVTGSARVGSKGVWQLWDGAGTGNYYTGNVNGNGGEQVVCPMLTIAANTSYEISVGVFNASNRSLNINVQYWDGGANFLYGETLISIAHDDHGDGSSRKAQFHTPLNCGFVRIYWETTGAGAFGGYINVGNINYREAGTGTLIVDGAIIASKIAADAIDATKVRAGTLTGNLFNSATSLPSTMSISNNGFSLGTVAAAAAAGNIGAANRISTSEFGNGGSTTGWYINDNGTPNPVPLGVNSSQGRNQLYINAAQATAANQVISICQDFATGTASDPATKLYQFSCVPGELLAVQATISMSNASTWHLHIAWTDASGNISNGIPETNIQAGTGNGNGLAGNIIQVPGGAVSGSMILRVYSAAAGTMTVNFSHPMVSAASPGQNALPAYVPGASNNPANVINANTTLISPGKILISGANTLVSWIYGGDNTSINGGAIAANTITANKLTIGNRNIQLLGITFSNDGNNTISWTAGYVDWYDENFNRQVTAISAGSCSRVSQGGNVSGVAYVWFGRADTSGTFGGGETTPGAIMSNPNRVIVASYFGGNAMNSNYGQTIIDGSEIRTGSIYADRVAAGTITGDKIAGGTITGTLIAANSITADKLQVNSLDALSARIGTLRTATSGARMELHDNVIKVYDSNNVLRVQIGDLTL